MGNPGDKDVEKDAPKNHDIPTASAPLYTEEATAAAAPGPNSSQPSEPPPDYEAATATTSAATGGPGGSSSSRRRILHRPFPAALHARYQWKLTGTFHLCGGAGSESERLFAAVVHRGLVNDCPRVTLHNGPTERHPFLADACEDPGAGMLERYYSLDNVIRLLPLPGAGTGDARERVREVMRARTVGDSGLGYRFAVEVEHGEKLVREEFEWRKSKKGDDEEVKDGGFKLLRLSSQQPQAASSSSSSSTAASEDGYEVVALFKWNKTLTNMMQPFELRFVGAGLSGSLGERWAVMAVITGLRLWWLHAGGRANRKTAAIGEGGMAGVYMYG